MSIDMISEVPSLAASPRISFSHDLCHHDPSSSAAAAANTNIQDYPQIQESVSSNSEFDFCIINSTDTETSSADELFSDGLIRPIQLQEKFVISSKKVPLSKKNRSSVNSLPPLLQNESSNQEIKSDQQKNQSTSDSKSFWGIKRSNSIHCVNSHKKGSSFWSLPLLSRSNSTGSVPNSKKHTTLQLKQIKNSSASASSYTFPSSQKPPLRKNYGAGPNYGTGIRITPVLNVASQNLFGLRSLFLNGKHKRSTK